MYVNKLLNKARVIGIIILFIGVSFTPAISGVSFKSCTNKIEVNNENQDTSSLTFYTFDKSGSKECNSVLSSDVAEDIAGVLEVLKYKIVYEPFSTETRILKSDFVDLLENNGLLPAGMSRDRVLSLLNPSWLGWFENRPHLKTSRGFKTGFINILNLLGSLQRFFVSSEFIEPLGEYPESASVSAVSFFSSIVGGGIGIPLPLFLLPRPRGIALWSAYLGVSNVGNINTGRGFIAKGHQLGVALGFLGVGFTFSISGETLFGFIGYSVFTYVSAETIDWYVPPNAAPKISDVSPANGAKDVSISLDELSFRISDHEGDRMSYTVTTSPDIGSGSGSGKKDGVYKVPVSGLVGDTEYSWHLVVKDKYNTVEKTFSFMTEVVVPVVSDLVPSDGDNWVPVDISELGFSLKDFQGDLMDYSVETVPDIGSGSGGGVGDGVYSVDVSGLDYTTVYSWFVNVTDGSYWTREVFSFKTQPIMVFDPFDEGWLYRKKITIDHELVEGDLSDFPVLVSVVDSDLRNKAQVDGDDILFMDGSGVANRLFHEIELYEDSSGELVSWVRIPSLDKDVDTIFYMYYGNSNCDSQQYSDKVWDSNYIAVFHMNDVIGNMLDSTSNINDFDVINEPIYLQDGKVGYCLDFDGIDDFFQNKNMDLTGLSEFTLTAWMQPDVVSGENQNFIFSSKYDSDDDIRHTYYANGPDNSGFQGVYDDGDVDGVVNYTHTFVVDKWYFYASTCDNNKGESSLYKDDELLGKDVEVNFKFNKLDNKHRIGHRAVSNKPKYFDGSLDEIKISKIARSENWILTEYNNQKYPSIFMSFGPEESGL